MQSYVKGLLSTVAFLSPAGLPAASLRRDNGRPVRLAHRGSIRRTGPRNRQDRDSFPAGVALEKHTLAKLPEGVSEHAKL